MIEVTEKLGVEKYCQENTVLIIFQEYEVRINVEST